MTSAACGNCDHFGVHSTPILFLIYPFHRIFSHPLFLVTLHAVVLWSAVIPLLLLCRLRLSNPWHRIGVLATFLCSPFLIKILDYQFHPEVFYVPLFLWFALLVEAGGARYASNETKRIGWLWAVCALILSVKEDGAVYLSAAVVAAALTRRLRPAQAVSLLAACVVTFLINVKWVIPANSGMAEYHLAGTSARFGQSVGAAAFGMLGAWKSVTADLLKGVWLKILFRFLFLPLLEPFFLIAVIPFALIHSVAESNVMRGLATYYSAPYLPWVFVAFVLMLSHKRMPERLKHFAVLFAFLSSFPAWFPRHFPSPAGMRETNTAFNEVLLQIGSDDSVCAQGTIFPHLKYPKGLELLSDNCLKNRVRHYVLNPSLNHWPYEPGAFDQMMRGLDADPDYQRRNFGNFILYSRK